MDWGWGGLVVGRVVQQLIVTDLEQEGLATASQEERPHKKPNSHSSPSPSRPVDGEYACPS